MFGVGPQEVVIIVGPILVIFGPAKAAGIARDLGRWVNETRRPVEELKEELASSSVAKKTKDEAPHSVKERNSSRAVAVSSEEGNDATITPPHPEDKERASQVLADEHRSKL